MYKNAYIFFRNISTINILFVHESYIHENAESFLAEIIPLRLYSVYIYSIQCLLVHV